MTERDDHNDVLVGYRRMAEFAAAEGYPVSVSTLQKRGAPAVAGYYGQRPATTKGLFREWLRSGLRPAKPAKRQKVTAEAFTRAAEGA